MDNVEALTHHDSSNSVERVIPIEVVPSSSPRHNQKRQSREVKDDNANTIQQSLPVTLADGTPCQTVGTVTHLRSVGSSNSNSNSNSNNNNNNGDLEIQEIGENTLKREKLAADLANTSNVRWVPIRLDDGKVIQQDPSEEKIELQTEFTNYSHQEFPVTTREIPRFDTANKMKDNKTERVIPIVLEGTGKTITPAFTKLEDPQPPEWSTFSRKNKSTEKVIPIRLADPEDFDDIESKSEYENNFATPKTAPKNTNNKYSGGARPKQPPPSTPTSTSTPTPTPSSSTLKRNNSSRSTTETTTSSSTSSKTVTEKRSQTVRFNIDDDDSNKDSKTKIRSSSADSRSYSRPKGRPPTGLSQTRQAAAEDRGRTRTRSGGSSPYYRAFSAQSAPGKPSQEDEEALKEIDRDITRIWRELQDLDKTTPPFKTSSVPSETPATTVKVREYSIPKQSASPTRVLKASPNNTADSDKRTIWNLGSDQLDGTTTGPNYMTPNATRRNRSGLVMPQWSTSSSATQETPQTLPPKKASISSVQAERGDSISLASAAADPGVTRRSSYSKSIENKHVRNSIESERNSFYDAKEYVEPVNNANTNANDKSTQTNHKMGDKSGNCIIV